MDDTQLVAAVRRGDADAVTALLEGGAVPDTVTDDGLPVLCLAVASYDVAVAEALVKGGADPDRKLPDGTTPLVRAVDGGSPAVVEAVLGREPRLRLSEAGREQLLALARHWYERSAEDELRGRTGGSGPVCQSLVMDDEYNDVAQLTLGGLTVRCGHGAILTDLEWAFRILTPVDELVVRAVARRDPDHVDWSSARWVLSERRSKETWSAVTAYRHNPDPEHRRFVLDVLRSYVLSPSSWRNSYEKETAELLVAWATEGRATPASSPRCSTPWARRNTGNRRPRDCGTPATRTRASVPRSPTSCSAGIHRTLRSARRLAPPCSRSPGTRTGEYVPEPAGH